MVTGGMFRPPKVATLPVFVIAGGQVAAEEAALRGVELQAVDVVGRRRGVDLGELLVGVGFAALATALLIRPPTAMTVSQPLFTSAVRFGA